MGMNRWTSGILGGFAGAAAFGIWMWAVTPDVIEAAIPGLYGLDGAIVFGGAIHLVHGVVLGLVFAAVVESDAIGRTVEREPTLSDLSPGVRTILGGLVYGLALWILLPVIVMPVWLEAVGFAEAPAFPNLAIESLVGHLLYGAVLGGVYAAITDR
jgi:hypothetical protein